MTITQKNPQEELKVVHPLLDINENKLTGEGLGLMKMSPSVKLSLACLRVYLILMTLMLTYHVFDLAGVFAHRASR